MRKVMPFWALGLLSGLIWGLWRWPAIFLSDYNAGEDGLVLYRLLLTLSISATGMVYAYFTFKSGSLWPAVILHASPSLSLQRIFTPLTSRGDNMHVDIDEFGALLPIVSCLLALTFYWRACREGIV